MNEQIRLLPRREPGQILEQAIRDFKPAKAFVMFSGGKDSSVTLDYLWRNHRELITGALHIDTGIGLASTQEFAKQFCEERGISLSIARSPLAYEDIVLNHGFPGPAAHAFMYSWLKERALRAFVGVNKRGKNERIMLLTGVRTDESLRRMGSSLDISTEGAKLWVAPLIDFTNGEMQEHRTYYSVPMAPASSTIHISGECLCGAFGVPSELDLIETFHPEEEAPRRIRALEKKMASMGHPRCKWATKVEGDPEPSAMPGMLCVGCSKHPGLFDAPEVVAP